MPSINTNRDNIMKFNNRDLAYFMLYVAPQIGLQYSDSVGGIEIWLDEAAELGLLVGHYIEMYGIARQ